MRKAERNRPRVAADFEVYNGDCMDAMKGMADESVALLVSDPPYAVGFASERTTYDDSKDSVMSLAPLWFAEWLRIMRPGAWAFVFTGTKNLNRWIEIGEAAGFTYKNLIATRSFNRGRMCFNNFVFELQPVVVFSKGGKGRNFNEVDFFPTSAEWLRDRRNSNPKPFSYAYSNWIPSDLCYGTETFGQTDGKKNWHPNAKSERLCRFFVEIASDEGDLVFDPFTGCGTTGAAAVSVGRRFYGCEQDPHWAEVARRRISGDAEWKRSSVDAGEAGRPRFVQTTMFDFM